jgi:deoxyguanosine kinase
MPYKYISIEGIIGAGKTMLAEYLAQEMEAVLLPEQFEKNTRLPVFYGNPEEHALEVESFFLEQRYRQLLDIDKSSTIIADYHFGKCLVFGRVTLPTPSKIQFEKQFWGKFGELPMPDLVLYLKVKPEKAKENILKRGREYEKQISLDYLSKLQKGYMDLFLELPAQRIVIADINAVDFEDPGVYYDKMMETIRQAHPLGISHILL